MKKEHISIWLSLTATCQTANRQFLARWVCDLVVILLSPIYYSSSMFQVNTFVALMFLFYFRPAIADDDCLWCPVGGALVKGSKCLWDGAVEATEAANLHLAPTQSLFGLAKFGVPDYPRWSCSTWTAIFSKQLPPFRVLNQRHDRLISDVKCKPENLGVSMQTEIGQKKVTRLSTVRKMTNWLPKQRLRSFLSCGSKNGTNHFPPKYKYDVNSCLKIL